MLANHSKFEERLLWELTVLGKKKKKITSRIFTVIMWSFNLQVEIQPVKKDTLLVAVGFIPNRLSLSPPK